MFISGAHDMTFSENIFTGAGTDVGIFVFFGATNITIENNVIERTAPGMPENAGSGVSTDNPAQATLVCNTLQRMGEQPR